MAGNDIKGAGGREGHWRPGGEKALLRFSFAPGNLVESCGVYRTGAGQTGSREALKALREAKP